MTSRATLPQEFMDITSAMMLAAPEPQYLYAAMWLQAVNQSFNLQNALRSGIDLIGRGPIANKGDQVDSFEKNQLMLEVDPVVGEFMKAVTAPGQKPGQTVRLNRPLFKNTTYTEASREVGPNTSISTTAISILASQVPVTLRRFAGPYDSDNSRVAPFGVDAFDSEFALHSVAQLVGMHLHRDYMKFCDTSIATLLDAATNTVRPTGFSADDDSVDQGDAPMDVDTLERANKTLDDANVPVGPDGRRMMVLHSNQILQLRQDPRWTRLSEDSEIVNPLLRKAYRGATAHFNIFQSTSLRTTTNSSSKTIYKGHAFGPGALGTAVAKLATVQQSTDDNFGEQGKVIWVEYAARALLDGSFGCVIRTS